MNSKNDELISNNNEKNKMPTQSLLQEHNNNNNTDKVSVNPNLFDFSSSQNNNSLFNGPSFFGSPVTPQFNQSSLKQNYYKHSTTQNESIAQSKIEETFNSNVIPDFSSTQPATTLPTNVELPKLQNIVSTANLKCVLELREIALRAKNAEYNPKRFAAVIMRIKEPKTTALIFASGKIVCTGARSEEDSRKAARQFAKIIQKLGYPVKFSEFKIQNIVGSCDVKYPIRLEGLASKYLKFSSYEPEMFPGLIFRMVDPKIVLLIFVSGKIVLTGAKDRNDIYRAFNSICPVLQQFRKKEIANASTELSINEKEEV